MQHKEEMIEIKVGDFWALINKANVKCVVFTDIGARQCTVGIMYYGEEDALDLRGKFDVEECRLIAECFQPINKPRWYSLRGLFKRLMFWKR